jgi:hypothetical protein
MCSDSAATTDSVDVAGAPEDEIEITPEMIEAGYKVSRLYDREDPKEWEIAAVYRAMEKARREIHGTGSSFGKA